MLPSRGKAHRHASLERASGEPIRSLIFVTKSSGCRGLCNEFKVIALALGVFQYRRGVSLAGKEEDVTVPKLLANRDCQLDSTHAWHYDVTEDQIRNPVPADFKG